MGTTSNSPILLRSEEHTSELQSLSHLVCRLLLEKKKIYRGKALSGLYGGIGRSVWFSGAPTLASTEVQGLNSIGGWSHLKYRPANKSDFHAAFGVVPT